MTIRTAFVLITGFILSSCNNTSSYINLNQDSTNQPTLIVNNNLDTFQKYSCLLLEPNGNPNVKKHMGTGFFIEYKHDIYLVSAHHVFFYPNNNTKIIYRYFKTNNFYGFDTLDLTPLLADKSNLRTDKPDVFAYKIGKKDGIFTINSFLVNDTTFIDRGVSTITYGYPKTALTFTGNLFPTLLSGQTFAPSNQPAIKIINPPLEYYATYPNPGIDEMEGRSGSPVFYIAADHEFHFYGIMVAGSEAKNVCTIVKFSDVYKEISKGKTNFSDFQ